MGSSTSERGKPAQVTYVASQIMAEHRKEQAHQLLPRLAPARRAHEQAARSQRIYELMEPVHPLEDVLNRLRRTRRTTAFPPDTTVGGVPQGKPMSALEREVNRRTLATLAQGLTIWDNDEGGNPIEDTRGVRA